MEEMYMKIEKKMTFALLFSFLLQLIIISSVNAADFSDGQDIFGDTNVEISTDTEETVEERTSVDVARIEDTLYNVNKLALKYGSFASIPSGILSDEDIMLTANTWGLFHTKNGKYIYVYDYCTVPGASSYYVRLLQTCLSAIAYDVGGIDGIYGPNTEYAIVQFQKDQKLTADGIAGENTWRRLSNYFADYGIRINF